MSKSHLLSLFLALSIGTRAAGDDAVARWNRAAIEVGAKAYELDPLTESRTLAMMHVAMHDALNAVERRYAAHTSSPAAAPGASPDAAVAAAAHGVLSALLPDARTTFDAVLEETLSGVPSEARAKGVKVGGAAAAAVIASRKDDGAARVVPYATTGKPGDYRPTPPEDLPAFAVQWGQVRPFALRSPSQFRPPAPPRPGTAAALAELDEVRRLGAAEGSERTAEQSQIAKYWYENSTQGWNRIAANVADARRLDRWERARLLALVNVAMADGFIAGFEAKYHHRFWRPLTALRAAGHATWAPFLFTPPVPDHPSTHTVLGAAAAAAMAGALGTDLVPFSMTSGIPYPGITRSFWSLSEAAHENGASRVLAGIHFPSAVREGHALGEAVGRYTFERVLRPVAEAKVTAAAAQR